MGANASKAVACAIGGVSPTFKVGSFVRVLPKPNNVERAKEEATVEDANSDEEEKEEKGEKGEEEKKEDDNLCGKSERAEWCDEIEALVGHRGIVMGGAEKAEYDETTVGFRTADGFNLSFQFKSSWLEPARERDYLPDSQRKSLEQYLDNEISRIVKALYVLPKINTTDSFFGKPGSMVEVLHSCNTDEWCDHQKTTLGKAGVVLYGVFKPLSPNTTIVFFPQPVCWWYEYENNELMPANENNFVQTPEYVSLCKLRTFAIDGEKSGKEKKEEDRRKKEHELLISLLEAMVSKMETIEQRLVHLHHAPAGGPMLQIEGPAKERNANL